MTLTYTRGVTTLAEFRELLARHEAELAEDGPLPVIVDCNHPYDELEPTWSARRTPDHRIAVTVRFRCSCGEWVGGSTKRVRP
jgi:hypothetical protein